jgi:formylglycine-generating enzyme
VESVSWDEAQQFMKKLNAKEKGNGWLYRLPINLLSSRQANFNGLSPAGRAAKGPYLARPTNVGSYAPNRLGLYDMHGNVWRWCDDPWELYDDSWHVALSGRVFRGGGWNDDGQVCRAADAPLLRDDHLGFRVPFSYAS